MKWRVLITLDVRNAFNMANWDLILRKLREFGVSSYLRNIISEYLKDRNIRAVGGKAKLTMQAGVPQGSVLGPTLWNILYVGVLRLEMVGDTICIGFADDLAIMSTAEDQDDLMHQVRSLRC